MGKGKNKVKMSCTRVKVLDDVRVEITLLTPLPYSNSKWIKFYTHGASDVARKLLFSWL